MAWKGVTVSEQRENFLRDYGLKYFSLTELAESYSVWRKTAYKWIERYEELGRRGLEDQSRRPHSLPLADA
jgi:putative transposase